MKSLQDNFKRKFSYLRLSITDQCNFRCQYCLPNGYQKSGDSSCFLSAAEVARLATAFAGLGVEKIRLTGGEPTLRKDITLISSVISQIPGIHTIAVTTNGYNLGRKAKDFYDSGVNALNVSVDSLDAKKFYEITGHDKLDAVMDGIEKAKKAGFSKVKINTVLLKGFNDNELPQILRWIKDQDLSVRFIELMQTGDNFAYFKKHHLSAEVIKQQLLQHGFMPSERKKNDGPAQEFEHPEYRGKIGIIAPYSKDFCKTCNRLRVTSKGDLRLCLFGETGYSLRPLLNDDEQINELQNKILELLHFKHETHYLDRGLTGITTNLASLGG
ncbi:MAG: cyclic pyranopterin phosphate synthase [Alphaproteobacteria bacterium RIFCSPLOWO2_01_FULL_40_26]|nr:MAG: cyclic pyranopterin phosphate synthase [Alphaproteobacteria bacterium RIFCSPHIGHO2_02_FULL_40_34]OFW85473.1 MAG: cyclic pyranopterin phosphate synthase [Alphaproteobacteria bacterium RIFCSPHIGHO2_01_FULL_40_8]OFW94783.1 MAG: cyclic pyranopterin phosphate synthase [Alphaproteobacteria bacterium RIFCSPLOWO2_01_FULL_40_26]OFX10412.1 MAG: cyclic pyranopterin phosphate synthase [Alphaproteobacteria bacterium RIFCSPLOWO2_02_FULL_40_19]OFX11293.1 MAG: cyclic pyranopterin phosphate synthase [Al